MRKRQLWKRCKATSHDVNLHRKYRHYTNRWRQELHNLALLTEKRVIESKNLGYFHRFVNKRLQYRTEIAALINSDANTVIENSKNANLLNDYFASVGVTDNGVDPSMC